MLIHDNDFVIADIKRARANLEAALIACDRLLAHDPETAVRAIPVTGETVVENAKRAWQFARSARTKRAELIRQRCRQDAA